MNVTVQSHTIPVCPRNQFVRNSVRNSTNTVNLTMFKVIEHSYSCPKVKILETTKKQYLFYSISHVWKILYNYKYRTISAKTLIPKILKTLDNLYSKI